MVDSWKLTTIGMWADKLEKEGALSLICDTFDWDELWEAAAELNQQKKLAAELEDANLELDTHRSKVLELEKKQRNFEEFHQKTIDALNIV